MYPAHSAALQMSTIQDLRDYYELPPELWRAFIAIAGDPKDDMRLLAVLPPQVVSAALERALLDDGTALSAVQASHVGLVYNLASASSTRRVEATGSLGRNFHLLEGPPRTSRR